MNVHGAPWLLLHWLGHEGGKNAVTQGGFSHGAFEQKHPVGQVHWLTMAEVDFHLARASFMNQRFHPQPVMKNGSKSLTASIE